MLGGMLTVSHRTATAVPASLAPSLELPPIRLTWPVRLAVRGTETHVRSTVSWFAELPSPATHVCFVP